MADVIDLSGVEKAIASLDRSISVIDQRVDNVDKNVVVVSQQVQALEQELNNFIAEQKKTNNISLAEQRIVKINQNIEKKYGHYKEIRRSLRGIVEATDLNIIKKTSISTATDELFIKTPTYWLAPALVAISAWINDEEDLANRALKEAMHRNSKKTAILFTLICRRANRLDASRRWVLQFLNTQSATEIDQESIVLIDAYANGLLGIDSKHQIGQKITVWMDQLSKQPGFEAGVVARWKQALALLIPKKQYGYSQLAKYSNNANEILASLNQAYLHQEVMKYFKNIYETPNDASAVKKQLDNILMHLVTDYDQEEQGLQREKELNELIVKNNGDTVKANAEMSVKKHSYDQSKDFAQVLTDTAMEMDPEKRNIAIQKLAIALSKEWIQQAYNDLVATHRANVPNEISFTINSYHGKTADGANELELLADYKKHMQKECEDKVKVMQEKKYVGPIITGIISVLLFAAFPILGVIGLVVAGLWVFNVKSNNEKIRNSRTNLKKKYTETINSGQEVIRALMAEVVDFRRELGAVDSQSENVNNFLDKLEPASYVSSLNNVREVKVGE